MKQRTPERIEFLGDIIITAVEGGVGYWAMISGYRWHGVPSPVATLTEHESHKDGDPITGKLDIDSIASAIGRIVRGEIKLRADLIKLIAGASAANDGGDIDAEGADVIAQVAVLGDVIYG